LELSADRPPRSRRETLRILRPRQRRTVEVLHRLRKPVLAGGARVISVAAVMKPGAEVPVVDDRASKARGIPDTRVSTSAKPKGGVLRACPGCGAMIDPSLPFCPQCGVRVAPVSQELAQASKCTSCGNPVKPGEDKFCAKCGARVGTATEAPPKPKGTAVFSAAGTTAGGPKIAIIDDAGTVKQTFQIEKAETTVGRIDGDFRFPADPYLIGSQIIRFRRLGYPGPHPPEADQTRRLGSLTPNADVAVLAQLRADGSARDTFHLSPGRTVKVGRENGDWVFPFDQTMSGKHAEIRGEDLEFIVIDDGSRNGIAVSVRGERPLKQGQKLLMGDHTMRVEAL
jgi:uncharacterized OB-fold protein